MRKNKRMAGMLFLGMIILGIIAQLTRSNVLTFDNNTNSLEEINNSLVILRISFFSDILMVLFYLLTALTLYNILKNVNKTQSLLFFVLTIISCSIMSMNMINHVSIIEINSSEYINANNQYDIRVLNQFFSQMHSYGYLIAQVFFGLWLLPLGNIIIKNKIMPKYFGIMLIAAGFGSLLEVIVTFGFPKYGFIAYPGLIIGMLGEFSFCFWLLFRGIEIEDKWK